jgi:flagellar basal-body rod modification protein FlgD
MSVGGVTGTSSGDTITESRQTIAGNFDTFLQLLVTQLRNQNPLDPLDTNQFTQQLVQFSSVEQQLQTNGYLQAMMNANVTAANSQAVSYIGKYVVADGVRTELGGGHASWQFSVGKPAHVTVTVKDANGNSVYTKEGDVAAGTSVFNWDGTGSDGRTRPDGPYSVTMEGRDADGALIEVSTKMGGKVTGIDFSGSEPVLLVGSSRVNLSSVSAVTTEDALAEDSDL